MPNLNALGRTSVFSCALLSAIFGFVLIAWGETQVRLRNGLVIRGGILELAEIDADAFSGGARSDVETRPIWVIDNGLRRVYIHQHGMVDSHQQADAIGDLRIGVWQPVQEGGRNMVQAGGIVSRSPFNRYGRRALSIRGNNSPVGVVQGISEVTPVYTRLDTLKGSNLVWDMRVATSSIPATELHPVLEGQLTSPDDLPGRLELARFFVQMEYFDQALQEMDVAIKLAPDQEALRVQRRSIVQQQAATLLREAMLRENSGQRALALRILRDFPDTGVAETKIRVEEAISRIESELGMGKELTDRLNAQLSELGNDARTGLDGLMAEMQGSLTADTLARLDDYQRLGQEPTLPLENRIALGLGGWMLGPGSGMQNLAMVRSLYAVRTKVVEYLQESDPGRRGAMLAEIKSMEGASPVYVAKMLSYLTPPIADSSEFADPVIPGMYRIEVPRGDREPPLRYSIQLPPEYSPYRRYPCIVALPPLGRAPDWEINWWAGTWGGSLSERYGMREGQAGRHGFIVIAPEWSDGESNQYQYTAREHQQVLGPLRDAHRRFSIDSDRVYLFGHAEGASAAWDIAGAHPDLWAGLIGIGGSPRKYVKHYYDNLRYVPMYLVFGELTSAVVRHGDVYNRYARPGFDFMLVGYRGRGDEDFYEEIHHLFEWMNLRAHRRPAPPKEYEVGMMRRGDQFFWGTEVLELNENVPINPLLFDYTKITGVPSLKVSVTDGNTMRVEKAPAKRLRVYLQPEMGLQLEERIQIVWGGKRGRWEGGGNLEVILEDARTRADRQHPFWAYVDLP